MHTLDDSIDTTKEGCVYGRKSEELDYDLPLVRELYGIR